MKLILFVSCFCLSCFCFSQKNPMVLARYKNSNSSITEYLYIGKNRYYYESTFFDRKALKMVNRKDNYIYLKFDEFETVYEFFVSFEKIKLSDVQVPVQYRRMNPDGLESIFMLEQYTDLLQSQPLARQEDLLKHFANILQANWSGKLNENINLRIDFERIEAQTVQIQIKNAATQVGTEAQTYLYEGTAEIQEHKNRKLYKILLSEKNGNGRFELYLKSKGMETILTGFWKNEKVQMTIILYPAKML